MKAADRLVAVHASMPGRSLCSELGERPADVALAWLLANPVVTAPIIGPRTMEQFEGSLRSLDIDLDAEVLGRAGQDLPGARLALPRPTPGRRGSAAALSCAKAPAAGRVRDVPVGDR